MASAYGCELTSDARECVQATVVRHEDHVTAGVGPYNGCQHQAISLCVLFCRASYHFCIEACASAGAAQPDLLPVAATPPCPVHTRIPTLIAFTAHRPRAFTSPTGHGPGIWTMARSVLDRKHLHALESGLLATHNIMAGDQCCHQSARSGSCSAEPVIVS